VSEHLRIEKAAMADGPEIQRLVNRFADQGDMLPRTLAEIYENLRDFFVIRDGDRLIACAALHIMWRDLAEIRSVAVTEEWQSHGLGALLVQACVNEARSLGLPQVFALTRRPSFFEKLGFQQVNVVTLPRKVWNECYRCPKFPTCDEVAVVLRLNQVDDDRS